MFSLLSRFNIAELINLSETGHLNLPKLNVAFGTNISQHSKEYLNKNSSRDQNTKTPTLSSQKSLNIAILGAPNAGKSTLLNLFVGGKISAVSPKRNTTRDSILGILSDVNANTQLVFHDTPGYVDYRDSKSFVRELYVTARETVGEVELALLVVDAAKRLDDKSHRNFNVLATRCLTAQCPMAIVMNKVDLVHPKHNLLLKAQELHDALVQCQAQFNDSLKGQHQEQIPTPPLDVEGTEFFMISAGKNDGVDDIKSFLFSLAKEREWEYECDAITDLDKEELISEIIREQIYKRLHKEIPYRVEQNTRQMKQNQDQSKIWFLQELVVPNESQKRIICGKNRNNIKAIIAAAEVEVEKVLQQKITIELQTKIRRR
mmetsp:Transcript_1310/g.1838  ORF Transcript_1310/g.1838 Transcript_1310/m.1838 type:complete len:375 (+) Transcript_1310:85-1209(+)